MALTRSMTKDLNELFESDNCMSEENKMESDDNNTLIKGCSKVTSEEKFYSKADEYWKGIPATINGMLGGYERVSKVDIRGSTAFLKSFIQGSSAKTKTNRALDCGAGIGRVSKGLLLPLFQIVDLAELNKDFLDEAPKYLGDSSSRVGHYLCCGLQDLQLTEKYDVIWMQWVTGHLTDEHFVQFLERCKNALSDGGIIVIKDNIAIADVELDDVDSSVTRNTDDLKKIYKQAGLNVVSERRQTNLPPELYLVTMTALSK